MSLYAFNKGHNYLDRLGIPRLEDYVSNVIIERREFEKEELSGELEFRANGVYLKVDGEYKRGFLFNKDYRVSDYGLPRYHLADCKTLQKFRSKGTLNRFYFWSNAPKVTVTQRGSEEDYPDSSLQLCRNCSNELVDEVYATTDQEFAQEVFEGIVPAEGTDMFGRPLNWARISRAYRRKMNFTCEQCGFGGSDLMNAAHRQFLDTHHVDSFDLTNTAESNLRCLCKLCHTFQDEHHASYILKGGTRAVLKNMFQLYEKVLEQKNRDGVRRFRQSV